MDKSDSKNIIRKHYQALRKLIVIVNKDFETESIHKLRVEYKKLRAFLRMISTENASQKKIKIPGKLKKAYAIAGSIRDLQLQHKTILIANGEEKKGIRPYLKLLEHHIKILQPRLRDIPVEKAITKSINKTGKLTLEKINAIVAGRFMNNNCKAIIAIIRSDNFSDVNMHTTRKHLKDIFYTFQKSESAGTEINFQSGEILNTEKKYFDELLEEFGNLQDKCTSIVLLDEHWLYGLGKACRDILTGIKASVSAEHAAIKRSLVKKLQHEIVLHLKIFQDINFPTGK